MYQAGFKLVWKWSWKKMTSVTVKMVSQIFLHHTEIIWNKESCTHAKQLNYQLSLVNISILITEQTLQALHRTCKHDQELIIMSTNISWWTEKILKDLWTQFGKTYKIVRKHERSLHKLKNYKSISSLNDLMPCLQGWSWAWKFL